ncbi:MAG: PDZ domain-containing protein [Planctomycetes bacterium]|nr:PDZ domain-containing protein [Planctomycetota bacterium]
MMPLRLCCLVLSLLVSTSAWAQDVSPTHLARFGAGSGPRLDDGTIHLLDEAKSPLQSNSVTFDRQAEGLFERVTVRCRLRIDEGGDGGAFVLLNTSEYGTHGPGPFARSWVEPNFAKSFAVGIDVHDPPNEEPFGEWGNVLGLPEREVSLHWDGREIVKRVAPEEFRGATVPLEIVVAHGIGGAEVTVKIGEGLVYDRMFIAGLTPYESRLSIGAGTRGDVSTVFDVSDLEVTASDPTTAARPPLRVEVFHHVMTDNQKVAYEAEVDLPPLDWAFGRVILNLDIHDGGKMWDEWDRNGEVSIWDTEGNPRGIVPFITSYRTPCHWEVDVTHFRPWLTGRVRFEIRAGTTFYKNRGYAMSATLDFHHGANALEPYHVVPLWLGTAHYRSDENHFQDFFDPKTVAIPADAKAARLFTTTTGHSQVGEFTPSKRTLVFTPDIASESPATERFENTLWKTDCYLNPNRPQYGTWKYPRAGWAPGDVVHPWWIDLTPRLVAGATAEFRYEPQPYDLVGSDEKPSEQEVAQASHVIRSYLILYRDAGEMLSAPVVRVMDVVADSNAAKVGLKKGDYLAQYDGRTLDSVDHLRDALKAAVDAGKETVPIVVYRESERLEIEIPAGRMGAQLTDR